MQEEEVTQPSNPEVLEKAQDMMSAYEEYQQKIKDREKLSLEQGLGTRIPQERYPQTGKLAPLIRKHKKVSRNEPCPCGSEKKYKSCCLK